MSGASIRDYRAPDLESCRALWAQLTERHRDIYEDPTIGGDDPGAHFDEYLKNPALRGPWVAEREGQVVGLAGLEVESEEEATLEPAIVAEELRSRGVGAQLVERVRQEARSLGIRFFNVRPVGRNREAILFFVREGFDIAGQVEIFQDLAPEKGRVWKQDAEGQPGIEVHGRKLRY